MLNWIIIIICQFGMLALAEQIGMNTRHLAAIRSSELRHHYFNELGATKLACLWVLEHLGKTKRR
jgi:hypothetical protein